MWRRDIHVFPAERQPGPLCTMMLSPAWPDATRGGQSFWVFSKAMHEGGAP